MKCNACRYYPVALLNLRRSDVYGNRLAYALDKEEHCPGPFWPRTIKIEDYRAEQGVAEYDDKARAGRQLVVKRKSAGPTIGQQPSPISNQLFFMASYDVDRFRAFVMSPNFNETYNILPEVMALLVGGDEASLDFGLNFLKHVLFGEKFIEEYPDAYEKRLARKREHS